MYLRPAKSKSINRPYARGEGAVLEEADQVASNVAAALGPGYPSRTLFDDSHPQSRYTNKGVSVIDELSLYPKLDRVSTGGLGGRVTAYSQ